MPYYACLTCGRPFTRRSPRDRRCPEHRAQDRSPSSLAAESPEYRRNREILLAGHPPCDCCGKPATTADHILPVALGGSSRLSNLVPACARCNYSRQARRSPSKPTWEWQSRARSEAASSTHESEHARNRG
jgi:5-methylcytosine-specific restriction endonuclease McrA